MCVCVCGCVHVRDSSCLFHVYFFLRQRIIDNTTSTTTAASTTAKQTVITPTTGTHELSFPLKSSTTPGVGLTEVLVVGVLVFEEDDVVVVVVVQMDADECKNMSSLDACDCTHAGPQSA